LMARSEPACRKIPSRPRPLVMPSTNDGERSESRRWGISEKGVVGKRPEDGYNPQAYPVSKLQL